MKLIDGGGKRGKGHYYNRIPKDLRDYVWVPVDDSVVEGYSFKMISQMEHSRGVGWVAEIYKNGNMVCYVENEGTGGANRYLPKNEFLYAAFERDANICYQNMTEPLDQFVQFIDILSTLV